MIIKIKNISIILKNKTLLLLVIQQLFRNQKKIDLYN